MFEREDLGPSKRGGQADKKEEKIKKTRKKLTEFAVFITVIAVNPEA